MRTGPPQSDHPFVGPLQSMNPSGIRSDTRIDQMKRFDSLTAAENFRWRSCREAFYLIDSGSAQVFDHAPSKRVLAVCATDTDDRSVHVRSMCNWRKWVEQLMQGS